MLRPSGVSRVRGASLNGVANRDTPVYTTPIVRAFVSIRAHRLAVQDVALSRRKQGFDSPWARQTPLRDWFNPAKSMISATSARLHGDRMHNMADDVCVSNHLNARHGV